MKVYEYFPAASMRNGFMQTVCAWKDAAVVEFGSEGTMHYTQRNIHGDTSNLFTSSMREKDIIFGDTDSLESAVREVESILHPKVIFVTSSPVSEVIGTDIALICRMLQKESNAVIYPLDAVPTQSTAVMGRQKAFQAAASLLERISEGGCDRTGALILGLTDADYNGRADMNEIRRMLRDYFGLDTLNGNDCRYSLADISRAKLIVSLSPEADILAEKAKELWDIPVISVMPYGFSGTKAFVEAVFEALGLLPTKLWQEERYFLKREEKHFREGLPADMRRRVYLDVRAERIGAIKSFMTEELGINVVTPGTDAHSISTDGRVEPICGLKKEDVLAANGILIRLYPENRSICLEEPVSGQRVFGDHTPYMGVRGAENMMTLLHPLVW